ncbi:MAG: hypothetical protein GSR84_04640 [Desulfurococcales archaeon]|nr:hypothetical protein [Desulfurococcales archaeon]
MARLYYQIYWDDKSRPYFKPEELASIVRAVADGLESLIVERHQLKLHLDGDVEVKVGFDPFIQVSSPTPEKTTEVWEKLEPIVMKEGGG